MTVYTCYACDREFEAPQPATKEDETKLFDATEKGRVVVVCEECLEYSLLVNTWIKAAHTSENQLN
jgi:hypothetical protein